MRRTLALGALLGIAVSAVRAQFEVTELFSTTWNFTQVVEYSNPQIKFVPGDALTQSANSTPTTPDVIGIKVLDKQVHQKVDKIGAGITDAASIVLQAFKAAHPDDYWELLHLLFSQDPQWIEKGGAGLSATRSPLGASDFGISPYSFDDTADGSTDPQLKLFTIDKAPKLWQTLQDIKTVNPNVRNFFAPWSPPGWMKADANPQQPLFNGHLKDGNEEVMAEYLVKAMVAIKNQTGINPYSLSVQNEPWYAGDSYSTSRSNPTQLAKLGIATRRRLNEAGLNDILMIAYDHNWDHGADALELFDKSRDDTWDGLAVHGYAGPPEMQLTFADAYEDKSIHFTEYTTTTQNNNEPWSNIKETATKILYHSVRYKSETVILWNCVLQVDEDGFTTPHLPNVCTNCNAPILLSSSATDGNATATLAGSELRTVNAAKSDEQATAQKAKRSAHAVNEIKAAVDDAPEVLATSPRSSKHKRRANSPHQLAFDVAGQRRALDVSESNLASSASRVNATTPKPANQASQQQTTFYKRSSDYAFLSHVSLATRPRTKEGEYGRLIGTSTTDAPKVAAGSDPVGGRVLASLFRADKVDPQNPEMSRFSLVLLNQNDHYETGNYEDATVTIWFRGQVANFTSGPGLYTLSWLAPLTSDDAKAAASTV